LLNATLIIILLLTLSSSSSAIGQEQSRQSKVSVKMINEGKINHLLDQARKYRSVGENKKAEQCYLEAIQLNEPNFGPNLLSRNIISPLASLYKRTNLQKAEQLYETYGRKVWDDRLVAEQLAPILCRLQRYAEARTVLRKYADELRNVPESRPLNLRRNELAAIIKVSEQRAPNLTEDDMNKIEKERAKKFGR